ncbi:hypothetical protein FBALC1_12412 [Flavobacteriales bacterium ALC-1]|nr:hypothetical protein FBALC1_12412 [Flavobacteriales bacterium ALC-1]
MKTKVQAFTLHEMVIVMIISTIVIGIAFTVLSLVQRHMWSIQQNFNLNTEFNRIEQALWIDTNRYNTINFNAIENEIKFRSEIDSTIYRFKLDYVLKDRDTFHITIKEKTVFFDGNKVSKGVIDALRLQLPKQYKAQSIFVFKSNDATQFID